MTSRVLLVLAFLVGACGCRADLLLPADTVEIVPPPTYRQWWEASRECIHKPEHRRFEAIRWFITDGDLEDEAGVDAAALTSDNRIILRSIYRDVPWIIQHELAHAINWLPDNPHPDDPFQTCHLMGWQ